MEFGFGENNFEFSRLAPQLLNRHMRQLDLCIAWQSRSIRCRIAQSHKWKALPTAAIYFCWLRTPRSFLLRSIALWKTLHVVALNCIFKYSDSSNFTWLHFPKWRCHSPGDFCYLSLFYSVYCSQGFSGSQLVRKTSQICAASF